MVYRNFTMSACASFTRSISYMYDYTPMIFTVSTWDSEVANSKTEIHITNTAGEVVWSCNVTTIEHEVEKCKSSVF